MIDVSVIATREPIWLEFGATVKIAHANFSFTTQSDMDDRSAVAHVVTYPAHGNYYSHGASIQSPLWLICFGEKGPLVLWNQMASGLLVGPFRAMGVLAYVQCSQSALLKYNVPVVMVRCLSLNPYSATITQPCNMSSRPKMQARPHKTTSCYRIWHLWPKRKLI